MSPVPTKQKAILQMLSVAPLTAPRDAPRPDAPLPSAWRSVLNSLRLVALQCRVAAWTDLFEACALISNTPDAERDAYASALVRCLRQAVAAKPVFFRPGTTELSFDEAWLIRALMAAKQGDEDSLSFLVRSRVAQVHQRHIRFLINGIAKQADLT